MNTVNNITPLAPVVPSRTPVRNIPSRKRREERQPAPRKQPERDRPQEDNDDTPHIDEYA